MKRQSLPTILSFMSKFSKSALIGLGYVVVWSGLETGVHNICDKMGTSYLFKSKVNVGLITLNLTNKH